MDNDYKSEFEDIFSEISSLTAKKESLEAARNRLTSISYDDICLLSAGWSAQPSNIDDSASFEGQNEMDYIESIDNNLFSAIDLYQASILDIVDTIDSEIDSINSKIEELESEAHKILHEVAFG